MLWRGTAAAAAGCAVPLLVAVVLLPAVQDFLLPVHVDALLCEGKEKEESAKSCANVSMFLFEGCNRAPKYRLDQAAGPCLFHRRSC